MTMREAPVHNACHVFIRLHASDGQQWLGAVVPAMHPSSTVATACVCVFVCVCVRARACDRLASGVAD